MTYELVKDLENPFEYGQHINISLLNFVTFCEANYSIFCFNAEIKTLYMIKKIHVYHFN